MKSRTLVRLTIAAFLLLVAGLPCFAQYAPAAGSSLSRVAGRFVASNYNYPTTADYVDSGNGATGSQTITLKVSKVNLPDGRSLYPFSIFAPILVGAGSNQEQVTPTAVSNCYTMATQAFGVCSITASFSNTHANGDPVASATAGLAEAMYDAFLTGGGVVVIDNSWANGINTGCTGCAASSAAAIQALVPIPTVSIEDVRTGPPIYWNLTPAFATALSAPSALAAGTVSSSTTVAGSASYAGGTIHVCYALVDEMGHEGPCSSDYSFTDTSTKAIVFTAPPAATGALGWVPYIGLESGSSGNEYQMPVWTQPTVIATPPASNGVCTLSQFLLQYGVYACALTNATYGQTGSGATVTAYPVVTSPQAVGTGGLSTASYYIGNSASRTVYQYQPGASPGTPGINRVYAPFGITTAAASTVPQILGTVDLPAGFMNYIGRQIEVCGEAYSTTQGASTVVQIEFEWDAQGSDMTTGLPVKLGGPMALGTLTTGTVAYFDFCQDISTSVSSASATGGSLITTHGYLAECALNTCATPFVAPNVGPAASASTGAALAGVGSLNLAGPARLQIVMVQTTSSTAVPKLFNLSVKILN